MTHKLFVYHGHSYDMYFFQTGLVSSDGTCVSDFFQTHNGTCVSDIFQTHNDTCVSDIFQTHHDIYICFVLFQTLLGPPNDTCGIQNDTTLVENQREMSLLVDSLRVGTTYTLSVVGYTEAGAGNHPRQVTLTTLSIGKRNQQSTSLFNHKCVLAVFLIERKIM